MSTTRLSLEQITANWKGNPYRNWFKVGERPLSRDPNAEFAADRIHSDFATLRPAKRIPLRDRKYFAIGSCFARRIEGTLRRLGGDVATLPEKLCEDHPELFRFIEPHNLRSMMNRYNVPSMLQEVRILTGEFSPTPGWLQYDNNDKWIDLHYCNNLQGVSEIECQQRREILVKSMRNLFASANTFILTLGLCEAWYDLVCGAYLNVMPPPRVSASEPTRFEHHFVGFEDNFRALEGIYESIARFMAGNEFEIVVTVSPIPLMATFTGHDIVLANCEAKSVLRAVAGEATRRYSRMTYFPAFEIVMNSNPSMAWAGDGLHVEPAMTDHVVSIFMKTLELDRNGP